MTNKAFFEGTLSPTVASAAKSTTAIISGKDKNTTSESMSREQVLLNLGGGYMVEMTRKKASDSIRGRMTACSSITARDSTKEREGKVAFKKGFLNSKNRSKKGNKIRKKQYWRDEEGLDNNSSSFYKNNNTNKKYHRKKREQQREQPHPGNHHLPYFEIREEYDKDGNEIKAEAVNVSIELEKLRNEVKNSSQQAHLTTGEDYGNYETSRSENAIKKSHDTVQTILSNLDLQEEEVQNSSSQAIENCHCKNEYVKGHKKPQFLSVDKMAEIAYEKITRRLKIFAKIEDEEEYNKSMNRNEICNRGHQDRSDGKSILDVSDATQSLIKVKEIQNSCSTKLGTRDAVEKNNKRLKFRGKDEVKKISRMETIPAKRILSYKKSPASFKESAFKEIVMEQFKAVQINNSNGEILKQRDRQINGKEAPKRISRFAQQRRSHR